MSRGRRLCLLVGASRPPQIFCGQRTVASSSRGRGRRMRCPLLGASRPPQIFCGLHGPPRPRPHSRQHGGMVLAAAGGERGGMVSAKQRFAANQLHNCSWRSLRIRVMNPTLRWRYVSGKPRQVGLKLGAEAPVHAACGRRDNGPVGKFHRCVTGSPQAQAV